MPSPPDGGAQDRSYLEPKSVVGANESCASALGARGHLFWEEPAPTCKTCSGFGTRLRGFLARAPWQAVCFPGASLEALPPGLVVLAPDPFGLPNQPLRPRQEGVPRDGCASPGLLACRVRQLPGTRRQHCDKLAISGQVSSCHPVTQSGAAPRKPSAPPGDVGGWEAT